MIRQFEGECMELMSIRTEHKYINISGSKSKLLFKFRKIFLTGLKLCVKSILTTNDLLLDTE